MVTMAMLMLSTPGSRSPRPRAQRQRFDARWCPWKRLGALPVAAGFLHRLDVAGIVHEVCPGGTSACLTHGQVIEAMVANRLTSPAPLVRRGD